MIIPTTLHLFACLTLAVAALLQRPRDPAGHPALWLVLPFILAAGLAGLLIAYGYVIEIFVGSYSGALYATGELTRGQLLWMAIAGILTLLPLAGLIPWIRRKPLLFSLIACMAAVPSVVSLIANPL